MNPFPYDVIINMKNAEESLSKEELQILNILIGKIQDFEEIKFREALKLD